MNDHHQHSGIENRAWPDRRIATIAERQGANVSHAQLLELGIRPSTITAALARGRLHAVHYGVHSLVPPGARPQHAAEHAALLACGPRAVLSHGTAARLHGLRLIARDSEVHVTLVGSTRGRSRKGLRAHRTRLLPRPERNRVAGLPVTSVARTVIDLAGTGLSDRTVENLVDRALKLTSATKLRETVARHPTRSGVPAVRRALDPERPSSDWWSHAERRLIVLLTGVGIPAPDANEPVGRYIPDLLWREYRVIVDYDSDLHHSGDRARGRDSRRHNDLTTLGYDVLHVTAADMRHPERVLVWVTAALTRRGWSPAAA